MKTKITMIALATIFSLKLFGQVYYGAKSDEIQDIAKNNIYVVLTTDETFNTAFENSLKTCWKQSTYKTINSNDMEQYLINENNYFLAPIAFDNGTVVIAGPNTKSIQDQHLALFSLGKGKIKNKIPKIVALCSFMIQMKNSLFKQTDYLVKAINEDIDLIKNNSIEGKDGYRITVEANKLITSNVSLLKHKTLLIPTGDDALYFKDPNAYKTYRQKCKVVTAEEAIKLIEKGDKEYCILFKGTNGEVQISIMDLESKTRVYAFASQNSPNLGKGDFEKINKTVSGEDSKK